MESEGTLEGAGRCHWTLWMKISTSREKRVICFLHLATRESQPCCQSSLASRFAVFSETAQFQDCPVGCVYTSGSSTSHSRLPPWGARAVFTDPVQACHTFFRVPGIWVLCNLPLTHCRRKGDSVGAWCPGQTCRTGSRAEGKQTQKCSHILFPVPSPGCLAVSSPS